MNTTLTAEAIHLSRGFFLHPFVRAIEKEFGFKGSKLLIDILFEVTVGGFECPSNKSFRSKVAGRNDGVSERLVDMVVHRMVKNGFLDQAKYASRHVLAIPEGNIIENDMTEFSHLPYFFVHPHGNAVSSEQMMVSSEEIRENTEKTEVYSSLSSHHPIKQ